jgi:hypothetical protein
MPPADAVELLIALFSGMGPIGVGILLGAPAVQLILIGLSEVGIIILAGH